MSGEEIKLLVMDVDGVLTDGALLFDDQGRHCRRFHIRDGLGITLWRLLGKKAAVLTSKRSGAVEARAAMMGIELIEQGAEDKLPGLQRILQAAGVEPQATAYIGDDLLDLVAMRRIGYPIAVADASAEVIRVARFVTTRPGGHGAVREAVEHLIHREGLWEAALQAIGADRGLG